MLNVDLKHMALFCVEDR